MATEQTPALDVGALAGELQYLLRRIGHLVTALDDASDELHITDERTREAIDRMCGFADIIGETAKIACDKAEQIEIGHLRARKAA